MENETRATAAIHSVTKVALTRREMALLLAALALFRKQAMAENKPGLAEGCRKLRASLLGKM